MGNLQIFVTALVVSMTLIPVMIRLAPQLGMVDFPDPRKVHARPVPRVGGIGIVFGSIIAVLLFVPFDGATVYFLSGAGVLAVFGAWDDSHELGHYVKFIGQFLAVVPLVYLGDLWVAQLPLLAEALPPAIGKPFTVFAIIGMINAINHSDGLDGLAGGESLLSLGCILYLAVVAGGTTVALTACAVAGGVFGFLRFNTHPARVFMGDAGSQFLGFSLAVLVVRLTQEVNPGLSMAIPALILGLPIVDILAVFAQRIYQRMNWFRASRNHIHHRLLDLGFEHYQAVIIIYSIHGAFTLMAALLAYESDFLILGIYCGACVLVFILLWLANRAQWRADRLAIGTRFARRLETLYAGGKVGLWSLRIVQVLVPTYFLINASAVVLLPPDSGPALGMLAAAYVIGLALSRTALGPLVLRLAVYVSAAFIVYMNQTAGSPWSGALTAINSAFFIVLVLAIAIYARFARESDNFVPTPMDFLIMLLVVAAGLFYRNMDQSPGLGALVVQVVVLFYGCELIILHGGRRAVGVLFAATATALAPLALQFL